jgi:Ni/Fe-hydrogenase subunit HybB-like protein
MPVLFVVSSIFAGLSLVIFEGSITHRAFSHRVGVRLRRSHDALLVGLARICAGTMFVYLVLELLVFVHGQHWALLQTGWGAWYLLEVVGFVAVPAGLFLGAFRSRNVRMVQGAAAMTLVGILLNRLNVSVIAFRWYAPDHYVPSWQEVVVSLAVVSVEIWVFRWAVNRMPVLAGLPEIRHERAAERDVGFAA